MRLGDGRQLLQELAEDDGAVHGVLDPQRLALLLGRAAEQRGSRQRLQYRPVPHLLQRQLCRLPRPRRAVGVAQDQLAQRRLPAAG